MRNTADSRGMLEKESYTSMKKRILSFQSGCFSDGGAFIPSDNLFVKVDGQGKFRPFYGDTIIFDLSEEEKQRVRKLQDCLYKNMHDMLAEPLKDNFFHLTLHDLSNGQMDDRLSDEMKKNQIQSEERLLQIKSEYRDTVIRMAPGFLMNMVNQSIVLALFANSNDDYKLLMELYECFEFHPVLWYFTPHITLAYYKPGRYGESYWKKGFQEVQKDSRKLLETGFTLKVSDLVYARFSSMNDYQYK